VAQLNYWSVDGREGDENRAELLSLRVETLINIRQRPDPEASGNTSFLGAFNHVFTHSGLEGVPSPASISVK
jgi:hypothetical protein